MIRDTINHPFCQSGLGISKPLLAEPEHESLVKNRIDWLSLPPTASVSSFASRSLTASVLQPFLTAQSIPNTWLASSLTASTGFDTTQDERLRIPAQNEDASYQ